MEDGLLTTHGKKLLMIGLFLWFVAVMIGGEDDPGLLAQQVDAPGNGVAGAAGHKPAPRNAMKVTQTTSPASRPSRQDDAALDAWYAASDSGSDWGTQPEPQAPTPTKPTPVDDSHLINDARPSISPSQEVR